MIELLPRLIPMLVVDVLNPVLFALLVVAVGTNRPVLNSTAFIAGHTIAYFVSGVIIAFGLEQITDRLENPHRVDFVFEVIIGLLCVWAALSSRDGKASEERQPEGELTPLSCFGFGTIVNFIGVPFALPYFAAIDQLLKANLAIEPSLVVLTIYNLSYALPFMLVPLMVAVMGDACKPILEKTNSVLVKLVDICMPILLLLLGAILTLNGLTYLISGEPLW